MSMLQFWSSKHGIPRDRLEHAVARAGGARLRDALDQSRAASEALDAALDDAQAELAHDASDAAVDAATIREDAVAAVALLHGVGIGAALAHFPADNPAALSRVAARVATAILADDAPPDVAAEVASLVVSALTTALRVRLPAG